MKEPEFNQKCPDCGEVAEECKCVDKFLDDDDDLTCTKCGELFSDYIDDCDCDEDDEDDLNDDNRWKGEKD